jgi:hypothetical protein
MELRRGFYGQVDRNVCIVKLGQNGCLGQAGLYGGFLRSLAVCEPTVRWQRTVTDMLGAGYLFTQYFY